MTLGISTLDKYKSKDSKERILARNRKEVEQDLDFILKAPEMFGISQEAVEFQFLMLMRFRDMLKGIPGDKGPLRQAYINFCNRIKSGTHNGYLFQKKLNSREMVELLKEFRREYYEATK